MQYRTYSAEYKMSMINEYLSKNITIRNFVKENELDVSSPINEVEVNLSKNKVSKNFGNSNLEALAKEIVTLDITNELIKNDINFIRFVFLYID